MGGMTLRRAAFAAPLLLLLLAGCVPTEPVASPTPEPSFTAPPVTPNPTPTITPTPSPETLAVDFGCKDVLSAQAIYDYNPNVTLLPSFSPSDSSPAGQAIAQQGLACELINQTSGSTIDFGVIRYTDEAYAAKVASVSGSATPASAFEGYFDVTGDGGLARLFSAPYYVTVNSAAFGTEDDISRPVAIVLDGLAANPAG